MNELDAQLFASSTQARAAKAQIAAAQAAAAAVKEDAQASKKKAVHPKRNKKAIKHGGQRKHKKAAGAGGAQPVVAGGVVDTTHANASTRAYSRVAEMSNTHAQTQQSLAAAETAKELSSVGSKLRTRVSGGSIERVARDLPKTADTPSESTSALATTAADTSAATIATAKREKQTAAAGRLERARDLWQKDSTSTAESVLAGCAEAFVDAVSAGHLGYDTAVAATALFAQVAMQVGEVQAALQQCDACLRRALGPWALASQANTIAVPETLNTAAGRAAAPPQLQEQLRSAAACATATLQILKWAQALCSRIASFDKQQGYSEQLERLTAKWNKNGFSVSEHRVSVPSGAPAHGSPLGSKAAPLPTPPPLMSALSASSIQELLAAQSDDSDSDFSDPIVPAVAAAPAAKPAPRGAAVPAAGGASKAKQNKAPVGARGANMQHQPHQQRHGAKPAPAGAAAARDDDSPKRARGGRKSGRNRNKNKATDKTSKDAQTTTAPAAVPKNAAAPAPAAAAKKAAAPAPAAAAKKAAAPAPAAAAKKAAAPAPAAAAKNAAAPAPAAAAKKAAAPAPATAPKKAAAPAPAAAAKKAAAPAPAAAAKKAAAPAPAAAAKKAAAPAPAAAAKKAAAPAPAAAAKKAAAPAPAAPLPVKASDLAELKSRRVEATDDSDFGRLVDDAVQSLLSQHPQTRMMAGQKVNALLTAAFLHRNASAQKALVSGDKATGSTVLLAAASAGNSVLVQAILGRCSKAPKMLDTLLNGSNSAFLVPTSAAALKHFSDVVQMLLVAGASCRLALAAPAVRSLDEAATASQLPSLLSGTTRDEIVQWFNERSQGGTGSLFLTGDARRVHQTAQPQQPNVAYAATFPYTPQTQAMQSHGMPMSTVGGGYGYYHPPGGSHGQWLHRQPLQQSFHAAHAGQPQRAMPPPGPMQGGGVPRGAPFIPASGPGQMGSFPPVQVAAPSVPASAAAVSAPRSAPAPAAAAPASAPAPAPAKARTGYAAAAAKPAAAPAPKPTQEQQLDGLMQAAAASEAAAAKAAAEQSAAAAAAYAKAEAARAATAAAGGAEAAPKTLGKKRQKPRTTQDASGGLWDGEADLGAEASTRTSGKSGSSWAARAAK